MIKFKEFIIKEQGEASITFVDIDDTLFNTFAKVIVKDKKTGKVLRKLSSGEFKDYKFKDDEEMDVSEFQDSKLFRNTSKAIPTMVKRINRLIKSIDRFGKGDRVVLLTARGKPNDLRVFRQTFRDWGINIDNIDNAHFVGGDTASNVVEGKAKVMRSYLDTGRFNKTMMFEDAEKNLKKFMSLKKEYPGVEFVPILVNSSGIPKLWKGK